MKTVSSILLMLLYFITVQGVEINTHYCMGELAEVAINKAAHRCCPLPTPTDEDSITHRCCEFDTIDIQITESQVASAQFSAEKAKFAIVAISALIVLLDFSENSAEPLIFSSDAPPLFKQPLWLLNHTFTFYESLFAI